MLLQWDEQRKTLEAAFDWKRDPSPHRNQQQVELQFRHPSFVKVLLCLYAREKIAIIIFLIKERVHSWRIRSRR